MNDGMLRGAVYERRGDMDNRFLEVVFEFRRNSPPPPRFRSPDYLGTGERNQHFYALVAAVEAWAYEMEYGVEIQDGVH